MTSRLRSRPIGSFSLLFCAAVFVLLVVPSFAAGPRVFPEGKVPQDSRLGELKDLNGYFPFEVPATVDAWNERSKELKRRVLVATGLWPMPEKTPLNPVIHGRVERDGFTVDKVFFESYPGHYVTGLLFRPEGTSGKKLPAVLCPHGHGGRLQDYGAKKVRALISQGAERFEASGRFPKLARCAQLARMGCVTFIFDMLGYVDSGQITYQLAHRFAEQRPEFENKKKWGLYSTQAELRLQSIMGIQTWNSIRALDFLTGLPGVDPKRVGVTGGSGGGTQTILLCAIDSRPIVAFPNGMVSTSMQGGCTCENCSLLRIGTGNVELAALFAPKPQGMTAANDWTREMMTKGYPQLQQLYGMIGRKQDVLCAPQTYFPHNYNYVTRAVMYSWFNKHLKLGLEEPIVEEDWQPLTAEEYTVWNDKHPKPKGGDEHELYLAKYIDNESNRQLAALTPKDATSLQRYHEVVGGAFETLIGRRLPPAGSIEREKVGKKKRNGYLEFTDILRVKKYGEELPVVSLFPQTKTWNEHVAIWVDGEGKDGLFNTDDDVKPEVRKLLDAGTSIVTGDLLFQGEFVKLGNPPTETRKVANKREFAGYTFTYNHTLFARRVHDILTLISWVKHDEHRPKQIHLVGVNGAGPLVAAARAIVGGTIHRAVIDTQGFRFVDLKSFRNPNFLPGAVKYGDVPGLLSLAAPHKLALLGDDVNKLSPVSAAYNAAGAPDAATSFDRDRSAAIGWLTEDVQ